MSFAVAMAVVLGLGFGIGWFAGRFWVRALVRWRLGPYKIAVNQVDPAAPLQLSTPRTVAVIGGGLAGVAAASTLAARGYQVTLFEANAYLGGKLGSWEVPLAPGERTWVSHGFHAFFRHYYNLNRFLTQLGIRQKFRAIADYTILLPGGAEISFGALEGTPGLNLLSMARRGIYRLRQVLRAPTRDLMGVFLEYDADQAAPHLDALSFADFDRLAQLPPRLKLAFNTFSRAFFADETKLSMAELVKAFHFYYLSHDGGLLYDYPTEDYERSLWAPIRAHLAALGVSVRLGTPVTQLARDPHRGDFQVNGAAFHRVVLAADVVGVRQVLTAATGLDGLDPRLAKLVPGQRYAVLRLWTHQAARANLPVFVTTDRQQVLDSVTFYDRAEGESAAWVRAHGGSVLELHCYAVPEHVEDSAIRGLLIHELQVHLPELQGMTIAHEHLAVRRDFPAFHVGMAAHRQPTASGVAGLVCAGDWVALPFPAMLLEAAFSSGLCAANQILASDGLRESLVESVPRRGLLAGVPQSPARRRLLAL